MKCQSKIDVSVTNSLGGIDQILIMGKMYECEFTPTIYDPMTLQPAKPSYIVKCEDGKFRKYESEYFIDIQELRESKLMSIGIV
jgi:hypothetical protein